MSLSDLAAIGSFVSGIAVVVSFTFLALQIRQANWNQRSLMQQGRTARNVDVLLKLSEQYISETVAQATESSLPMEPARILAFYGFAGAVFWSYEDSFIQFQAGTLDAHSWDSDVTTIKRLLGFPAYRVAWKMARDGMSGGYRDFVDAALSEVKCDPSQSLSDMWNVYMAQERQGG